MPTPTRPVACIAIPTRTLDALIELLERTAPAGSVDRSRLEQDLLSAFHATGVAHDGSAAAVMWHEAAEAPPDHKALALGYRHMAGAPDPLDPAICTAELRPELNWLLDRRWSARWRREGRGKKVSLDAITWGTLSAEEQAEIREMARHLAAGHKAQIQARRPRKNVLDTLLTELATIFVGHGGLEISHHDLPHAVNSYFIRFATAALASFCRADEVTPGALSHRWRRLKSATNSLPTESNQRRPARRRNKTSSNPL